MWVVERSRVLNGRCPGPDVRIQYDRTRTPLLGIHSRATFCACSEADGREEEVLGRFDAW